MGPERARRDVGKPALARVSGDFPLGDAGEALGQGVRRIVEPHVGFDLDGVRVHRGDAAAVATAALGARAFTVGRDIAFAPGEFRPDTAAGRRLLVHELTHVAQQAHAGTALIQRQPKPATEPWEAQLKDVLPGKVGLIVHMDRVIQLMERFSTAELNELIGLIHANPDATKFTRDEAGVPGIFALQETRSGKQLDVAAARALLSELSGLIHANPDAEKFTRNEAGVAGIFALQETRIGKRLDVRAARFLLKRFPKRPALTPGTAAAPARQSDESKAQVFSEDVVRDAYIRFHFNAILPGKNDPKPPDLPDKIRQNCIAIVHDLAPKLFTDDAVVKKIIKNFQDLRKKGETYTMVHTGEAMAGIGVADPRVEIKFKDAAGKVTNGNTEPTTLVSSAWDKVMDKVGTDYGWHVFGMAVMDGHHSVTLFVDNQPGGKTLYWADQWRIDQDEHGQDENFSQVPGAVSGFRQYEKAGFDAFIEWLTNHMWNTVHSESSDCADRAKKRGADWKSVCRYNATLMLWQLRKVVQP